MKLIDIVKQLDLNNKDIQDSPDWEQLSSYLGEQNLRWSDDTRLKSYWLQVHYEYGEYVGLKAYFLDNKFVCISMQNFRKSPINFAFVSKEIAIKVLRYLESLVEQSDPYTVDLIGDIELENEYKIEYSSQIMKDKFHKFATYLKTHEVIEIISSDEMIRDNKYYSHNVKVRFPNGKISIIDCRDLRFKYGVNYESTTNN